MARTPTPRNTTILLVRHGATGTTGKVLPGRAPGLHLSATGLEQARRASERLGALDPAPRALYASPLERTRETAAPIARRLDLRVKTERGLLECDFGSWTGQTLSSLRKTPDWRMVQHAPSAFRFPEGESFAEMQLRIWSTLDRLARAHRGDTIVLVSHADPIKAAVTYALGVPLDLFQRTVISTCSISALVLGDAAPLVLSVNNTGSLKELIAS